MQTLDVIVLQEFIEISREYGVKVIDNGRHFYQPTTTELSLETLKWLTIFYSCLLDHKQQNCVNSCRNFKFTIKTLSEPIITSLLIDLKLQNHSDCFYGGCKTSASKHVQTEERKFNLKLNCKLCKLKCLHLVVSSWES